jgi:hypothetical protein
MNNEKAKLMREVLNILNRAKFEVLAPEMVQMTQTLQKFAQLIIDMEKEDGNKS